ncbi:MAG: DNA repair protein RecN [Desulfuromonadales bacterium]|nr:DNA repair protein RecN [Desulfuromonadales bacterium]MBN2791155.1 DNA repair protein RecN [Desulfuromonadales bacterium]
MLSDLIVKNFAIIENLHARFSSGFNVLTGETGAGKSIIIDAVNLLLGGRVRGEVIRTGEQEASVEAIFDLGSDSPFLDTLVAAGLDDGSEFVVRRILARNGKNRVFVNGSPVSLTQLRELTAGLVNIYGQHEHQSLQRIETHLSLLDHFAGLQPELQAYQLVYKNYLRLQKKLEHLDLAERDRRQRLDMLAYQQKELQGARLQEGEDNDLEHERSLLLHAEKLAAGTSGGYAELYSGDAAACEAIAAVAGRLEALQQVDPNLGPLAERLREYQYGLEDVAEELRTYSEALDFEADRQQQVEERLALLASLKRKYAPSVSGLLEYLAGITQELEELKDIDGLRAELSRELTAQQQALTETGRSLSRRREKAAAELSATVERELAELAMPQARFSMKFVSLEEPAEQGLETGEFYLAANPGEAAQPLAKIASGGELSRIMLALKRSVPEGDGVRTLIFDEVDAGIGGEAATAVGEKISRLGTTHQVLCVTHLPQVAAFSNHHYRVAKQEQAGRTSTTLTRLGAEDKVFEIARMLGGSHAGRQAQVHARELIAMSCPDH